jgi:NifU-like protein
MGMEALQAAIADYKGEPNPFETLDDHDGKLICKCFGVTDIKILRVAKENDLHRAEEITNYCKAGGACGACLGSIQRLLDDMWRLESIKKC